MTFSHFRCSQPVRRLVKSKPLNNRIGRYGAVKYISMQGEQTVRVENGDWQLRPTGSSEFELRFFLNFPDGAVKNDVNVPAQRV